MDSIKQNQYVIFVGNFFYDCSTDFSAMLVYTLLIAIFPIGVALFEILGIVLKICPTLRDEIRNKSIDFFPSNNITQAGIRQV